MSSSLTRPQLGHTLWYYGGPGRGVPRAGLVTGVVDREHFDLAVYEATGVVVRQAAVFFPGRGRIVTSGAWCEVPLLNAVLAGGSSAPGFPDAGTTGPQPGTVLTNSSGELRTTANNQVIQNLNHSGYILVMHNNVTIQDCVITGGAGDIFSIGPNGVAVTGTKILRCKIVGGFGLECIDIELMTTTEVGFCDLSNVENGIVVSGSGVNIHDNYIHGLSRGNPTADAAAHFDGIQGFPGPYTSWTINHNTIQSRDTSGVITAGPSAVSFNVGLTVSNNLFLHNFSISYGMQVKYTDQLTISNNRISIDNPGAGPGTQRPIYPIDLVGCSNTTVTGNLNHETGAVLVPQASIS